MGSQHLYVVSGMFAVGEYQEEVLKYKILKETPTLLICKNIRVLKDILNKVYAAYHSGSFKVIVLSEEEITKSRELVKAEVLSYHKKHASRHLESEEITKKYDLSGEIKIRNGG